MSYSEFSLRRVGKEFDLTVVEEDLFVGVDPVDVGPVLSALLEEYVPLASDVSTEKARSELIVAPILLEVRRRMDRKVGFFSGIQFDVDSSRGLNGFCDYLITRSPAQLFVSAPVLAVVEAKNEDIIGGLGQCAAEMVAARIFNDREGEPIAAIHGVVTSGTSWRFLRLKDSALKVDRVEYAIHRVGDILAILLRCVGGTPG